jgi:hypothetical protein
VFSVGSHILDQGCALRYPVFIQLVVVYASRVWV